MRKSLALIGLACFASVSVLILNGCKGQQGPVGPKGDSTVVSLTGFTQGIVCANCHNPDTDTTYYVWAKEYQWQLSKHAIGGDFDRNQTPCSGCHTTEGYVQRMLAGNPPEANWTGIVTSQVDASPPGCFACHSPHTNGDFRRRTVSPVSMISPMNGVANQTIDLGNGNTCLSCHQPRSMSPLMPQTAAATDSILITNNRWYPHYGVQGLMYKGAGAGGGFEYAGSTYSNSPHPSQTIIQQQGCPTCHMADATAGSGIAGGHTMNIHYTNTSGALAWLTNGCTQAGCHTSMPSVDSYVSVSASLTGGMGVRTFVVNNLDTLKLLLVKKAYLDTTTDAIGIPLATTSKPLHIPVTKAGALYNYLFISHDLSNGIHNSKYAIQLLIDSIAEMKKP